ncbi:MAG: DUF4214 domain-containing protein [Acidimicrobiales bacterium]
MTLATLTLALSGLLTALQPLASPVGHLPTAEDFVIGQYEDFLSRHPDVGGLTYWTDGLEAGLAPAALVESLARSDEFEGTIAPVVRLYYAFFLRPPDYDGLTHWAGVARGGTSQEWIAEQFVRSEEFALTYGSLDDERYVERVYANVLGRSADPDGLAYWREQLAGGLGRGGLMAVFASSTEYRAAMESRVLATMLYVGMLRRAPENVGLDYWASTIGDGTPYRNVIAGFLGADEYERRIDALYDEVHPLTGVATEAVADRPALAVKVDNVDRARPQAALDRADVVYEEMVEGSLTRLVAVYHSHLPEIVGPVRSVRTTDLDLLDQLRTPLLAASGANRGVLDAVAAADLVNVNALVAGRAYHRDTRRAAPHNLYATTADLYGAADGRGGRPTALFAYRPPGAAPVGGLEATGVDIAFGRADVSFAWSPGHHGWVRRQNGTAHVTAGGRPMAPANVVVLEVAYGVSSIDADSPEAHTVGLGPATVLTAGRRITGTWRRAASTDPIELLDGTGATVTLTPGQTFVELAPAGSYSFR